MSPLAPLFCEAGEKLDAEVRATGSSTHSSVGTVYWCTDEHGNQRNVNKSVTPGTTLIFLALLFSGMGVALGSHKLSPKAKPVTQATTPAHTLSNRLDASTGLTAALKDLEEARARGLISEDEYQRLRNKALERFG